MLSAVGLGNVLQAELMKEFGGTLCVLRYLSHIQWMAPSLFQNSTYLTWPGENEHHDLDNYLENDFFRI